MDGKISKQIQNLEQRIAALAASKHMPVHVEWTLKDKSGILVPECRTINNATYNTDGDESKLVLTSELFSAYQQLCGYEGNLTADQLSALFGNHAPMKYTRFMGTLTRQGTQLRIWTGLPCEIGVNHAESNGDGLLIDINGDQGLLSKYAGLMLPAGQEYKTVPISYFATAILR